MRLFVIRDPQIPSHRWGSSFDINDYLFTVDHDIELVNYIIGCGQNRWISENHTIHQTHVAAIKDLCNRCVKIEKMTEELRGKIVEEIQKVESED